MDARQVIEKLELAPHPKEGGWFREIYRSAESFAPGGAFEGARSRGTAIYYLLTPDTFSAMHRLPGDEIFHFYLGDPVEMLELMEDGSTRRTILGPDLDSMSLVHVVPGGTWQGSRLVPEGRWALLGTTMAPGFDYVDYATGGPDLLQRYPEERELVESLLSG